MWLNQELQRLDYKLTGTKPTVGTLNRDPAQVTAEQNLAKLAEALGLEVHAS